MRLGRDSLRLAQVQIKLSFPEGKGISRFRIHLFIQTDKPLE